MAKIGDLGTAKEIVDRTNAQTGYATAYYAPPELFTGEYKITFSFDIWSLGVILYEMLTL